ncbi:hypothetical protein IQ273_20040 [Nodosilinea sp. LEGE 07298]|uniref:hypothetical protein n=1 Tax=Nodosilinea sp. LEGE 07298 TaxID=2777970 RepID=UPI001881DBC5|nr:hypothetical protein [Nodosilinea sp. LEGE 07298]MBE9111701.1 hypothetical protein [Nodosilinea sp. LEGE 07298]
MPNLVNGPSPRRAKVQTQRIGIDQPVYVVRFSVKSGPGSCQLPRSNLLTKTALSLAEEGVSSSSRMNDLFRAEWTGDPITTLNPDGEQVYLIVPGDVVTMAWCHHKLTYIAQSAQSLGECLGKEEGWMFAPEQFPTLLDRIELGRARAKQLVEICLTVYDEAHDRHIGRVERIVGKIKTALMHEIDRVSASIEQAIDRDQDPDPADLASLRSTQQQLEILPKFEFKLLKKFPKRGKLAKAIRFGNSEPEPMASMVDLVKENAEALGAIAQAEEASAAAAIRRTALYGLSALQETVQEKIEQMVDDFNGHVADVLYTLDGVKERGQFSTRIANRVQNHLTRLEVLAQILARLQALGDGRNDSLDQGAILAQLQEFKAAFELDERNGGGGRDRLLERLDGFRVDMQGAIMRAQMEGDGADRLASWAEVGTGLLGNER